MKILIPMAGAGKRFADQGYPVHKPLIPTIDRRSGKTFPMVICATLDLPGIEPGGGNLIYVDRDFHKRQGIEDSIREFYPLASFITVDHLTEGQACTCLLAREQIHTEEELLIAGCDNGMSYDTELFQREKQTCDALVFTYRHHPAVLKNPAAYGWMIVDRENRVTEVSIKKAISENPLNDHAVVATFWFRHGADFVKAAEQMIAGNDRINGEFYVDQAIKYLIQAGLKVKVFEIQRYLGWGTPEDYEAYMQTYRYWKAFVDSDAFLGDKY